MAGSFIFYQSFQEAISLLPPEDRLEAYEAIMNYGLYGEEDEPTSPIAKAIFLMAKPQIDANSKRRDGGRSGGRPAKKPMVSEKTENEKPNVNVNENVNVNVNEKENVKGDCKGGTGKRFTAPSIDQVREYCRERDNHVDPDAFYAFYESNGWKVGKNPMKDWRAAVRTWEQREKDDKKSRPKNQFHNFEQRDHDYEALERALSGRKL